MVTKTKTVKKESRQEIIGKYFLDLSKLTYGALVLGLGTSIITTGFWNPFALSSIWGGMLATIFFATIGYNLLKQ